MTDIHTPWREIVGNRLKEIRQSKGMTQNDVASLSGMQRQNMARIEKGLCDTRIDTIGAICDALGVTIDIKPIK